MRTTIVLIWFTLIALTGYSQSTNINRVEYFFDNDPGYGLATSATITTGKTIDVTFNANISSLADGFHTFFCRARDASGNWSTVNSRSFLKEKFISTRNITYLEYFIDSDPGYGSATPVSITSSSKVEKVFLANIGSLPDGFHTIFIRIKDANNIWSTVFTRSFLKEKFLPNKIITKIEYFLDTDPGYGKATQLSITPGLYVEKAFIANIGSLPDGFHTIYIRAMDNNFIWSTVYTRSFLKEKFLPNKIITKLEYFIDTDPGYGKASDLPVTSANFVEKSFIADISSLPDGFHTIFIRAMDDNFLWSTVYTRNFLKEPYITFDMRKIDLVEYFVDTDPGFGKATPFPIPLDEQSNILIKDFIASLPDLGPSNHRFFLRCKDKMGNWSHTYDTVYCQGPSAKFTVDPVCIGGTSELKFNTSNIDPNTSFYWDIDNNGTVESTTKGSINWQYSSAGNYSAKLVVINNSICPNKYKDSAIVNVIVSPLPSASLTPSGDVSVCPGDGIVLAANTGTNLTYQWYKDNNLLAGVISSSFNATETGAYKVVVTSPGNCSATSNVTTVSFKAQPLAIITPVGKTDLCPGEFVILNANSAPSQTYQWQLNGSNIIGATNTNINVNYTGTFNLVVTNNLGCKKTSGSLNVVLHPYPTVNLGKDTSITFKKSITLNPGNGFASYLWNDSSTGQTLTLQGSVLGLGTYDYSVSVTDIWGCFGRDSVKITVSPPSISGIVQYENNALKPLDSVKVYLFDTLKNPIDSTTTNALGKYIFKNINNGKYIVEAKTKKKWNGSNPTDGLLISRFFVKTYSFASVLKSKAADVNLDLKINPTDALQISRRFVKLINSFKSGDWIFESLKFEVKDDDVNLNIKGLCFGDVNGAN